MIEKLRLKNFRGIADAEIAIAPLTILTGANNSGKSSIMYALLTLRNIISNPNQPLDSFFNFLFINLNGFKETVYLKEEGSRTIMIEIESRSRDLHSAYRVTLGKSQSTLQLTGYEPSNCTLKLDVTFPYGLNLNSGTELEEEGGIASITWNGITPTVALTHEGEIPADEHAKVIKIADELTLPTEDLRKVDFVPLKRGFVKPVFSPVPLQPQIITEEEIATLIANDRDLEATINFYLEKVVNMNFQARPTLGTANFYLQTTHRDTGFLCDLVNNGFGTNQLVYLLAKALSKQKTTICIEEPEIHLHPSALVKLVEVLIQIAKESDRTFIISTHSEHFVMSLLNKLARKTVLPEDVRIYYLRKEGARTKIEEQKVTEKGQVEGGLKGFYETELEQLQEFLGVKGNE